MSAIRKSSVDSVVISDLSTANWCNVLAVLDNVAQYLDGDAHTLVCDIISAFPLKLSEVPQYNQYPKDNLMHEWRLSKPDSHVVRVAHYLYKAYGSGSEEYMIACKIIKELRSRNAN